MSDRRPLRPPLLFHAVLRPRRSAGKRGARVAIGLVAGGLAVAGAGFLLAGAWPVIGFGGLEVALLWGAFCLHGRASRTVEELSLTENALTLRRDDPGRPPRQWSFQPYWLRVTVVGGAAGGVIELSSHGRSVVIGAFLGAAERQCLAADLIQALAPLSGLTPAAVPRPEAEAAPGSPCRPASA
jgi:uncharacterized membrane protein